MIVQENEIDSAVCKMVAILSQTICVNSSPPVQCQAITWHIGLLLIRTLRNKLQWNSNQNVVYEIVAILSGEMS